MRSNSISNSISLQSPMAVRSMPNTPSGGGWAASPASITSIGSTRSLLGSGQFSSNGLPLNSPASATGMSSLTGGGSVFGRRGSIFSQPGASLTIQTQLQRAIFTKLHEEIYTILQVTPKMKQQQSTVTASLDVLAAFGGSGANEDQSYYLVLTTNNQIKKSTDGFGAPKLHWVKIKPPEHVGGEVTYNYKKFKLLKLLKRIEMSNTGSSGTMVGGSNGSFRNSAPSPSKDEFTLVFRSGDQDKYYSFYIKPVSVGPTSLTPGSGSVSGPSPSTSSDRSIFVWYVLEICRSYCGFIPTSNIDTVLYQQLTSEITSYYLAEPPPPNVPTHLRNLFLSVSKNRSALAELDSKVLEKKSSEEKVIVPSMTNEETILVKGFLKQIEEKMNPGGTKTPSDNTSTHSYLNELESFLLYKLQQIEHANIQSLFDSHTEAVNHRILNDDIQTNLLDNKLEEMTLWINHHNTELSKMKKGIELIEKRNMNLDIQEKNQTVLYETLHAILDRLKLDQDPGVARSMEILLENPDFTSRRLTATLEACHKLDHVLHLEIDDGKLEDLLAVKEQRLKYTGIRNKFVKSSDTAIEHIFQEVAKKVVQEVTKATAEHNTTTGAGTSLETNETIHRDLRKYGELLRYLERFDLDTFLNLRSKYTASMKQVYEVKLRAYFVSLNKTIAIEHKSTSWNDFPDWTLDLAKNAVRRTEGGRNISTSNTASFAVVLKQGPNAPLPSAQAVGKILATQSFVQALGQISPSCLSEERFLTEFFGHSKGGSNPLIGGNALAATANRSTPAAAAPTAQPTTTSRMSFLFSSTLTTAMHHSGKSDQEEIKAMMAELFKGLEPELRELIIQASKMDHFYILEMLVTIERIMAGSNNNSNNASNSSSSTSTNNTPSSQSEFLESILTSLSTHLKLSFTSFIDTSIESFSSARPSSKRCGILTPFLKFPGIVDRMENIVHAPGLEGSRLMSGKSVRSQIADTSYQKLASALFKWLDLIAKSDEKYQDVVYIENMSFFVSIFTTSSHFQVPTLEQFIQKAQVKYAEHLHSYVQWNIEYEIPTLTKFWNKLEDELKNNIPPEDIPFASDLSKHDLRAINKNTLDSKILKKSLGNILKRIEKHMPKNPLMVQTVWHAITTAFLGKLARFEELVSQCYQNEKLAITQQEAAEIFQSLLPNAGTYRPSVSTATSSS